MAISVNETMSFFQFSVCVFECCFKKKKKMDQEYSQICFPN